MEEKHLVEMAETVKMAQSGYWLPLAVVAGLFGIIVMLIIVIWNRSEKYHHGKHRESDDFRREYEKQMIVSAQIHENHEIRIEHLEKKK
jgi:hypothetical protein